MLKQLLPLVLCFALLFNFNSLFAQAACGATFSTMIEPIMKTTFCSDGSDAAVFQYNIADNLSMQAGTTLPDFAYVFEGPNGLTFLESGSLVINPLDFGAFAGDSICATGFAVDLADINGLISTLSNTFICTFVAGLDAATCAIISNLNDAGGIQSISQALTFSSQLNLPLPTSTNEAISILAGIDSISASLGGVCYAISNNGVGFDYCYVVEDCCEQIIVHSEPFAPLQNIYEVSNYIESTVFIEANENITYSAANYILLDNNFEVDSLANFNAIIEGCFSNN